MTASPIDDQAFGIRQLRPVPKMVSGLRADVGWGNSCLSLVPLDHLGIPSEGVDQPPTVVAALHDQVTGAKDDLLGHRMLLSTPDGQQHLVDLIVAAYQITKQAFV